MNASIIEPALCQANNSLLVIVDIQTRLTAAMPAKVLARIQRNTATLIKSANLLEIPVMVTKQYPKGLGPVEAEVEKLLPANTAQYEKTTFSCAGAGDFKQDLQASGKKQVVLTGMETHVCVLQTALDLKAAGYQVFVAADAVCSRHRDNYEIGLQRLRQEGVVITVTESIVYEWMQDSRHQAFKQIQTLVR